MLNTNEYLEYLNQQEADQTQQYMSQIARQQNLRSYVQMNIVHPAVIPPELLVVLNYLYEKEIKSTKFNNISLEKSIYDSIVVNDL